MSSTFAEFGVPAILDEVLAADGIHTPTPIQAATLTDSLSGRDVLARGKTGSGKTYGFSIPLVARLAGGAKADRLTKTGRPNRSAAPRPRGLVLAPTRELARQIDQTLRPLAEAAGLTTTVIYGGVPIKRQIDALGRGVDIVVACPGRLEDLIRQNAVELGAIQVTVLDEADHMADLGFLPAVRRLLSQTPGDGQRLLFSATLDSAVDALAGKFLRDPVSHSADPGHATPGPTEHHLVTVEKDDRVRVIATLAGAHERTVVFTRTKHGAKRLAKQLTAAGMPSVDLHGNLSQNARVRNLEAFSTGAAPVLVATDIAARGIHVDDVGLVIHADPPAEHKAYVHRSGRTARAGAVGTVASIATSDQVSDFRPVFKSAGVKPTETRIADGADVRLAGGDVLTFVKRAPVAVTGASQSQAGSGSRSGSRSGQGGGQGGQGSRSGQGSAQSSGRGRGGRDGERAQRSGGRDGGRGQGGRGQGGRGGDGARDGRSGQRGQARTGQQRTGQQRTGDQRPDGGSRSTDYRSSDHRSADSRNAGSRGSDSRVSFSHGDSGSPRRGRRRATASAGTSQSAHRGRR